MIYVVVFGRSHEYEYVHHQAFKNVRDAEEMLKGLGYKRARRSTLGLQRWKRGYDLHAKIEKCEVV